MASEVGGERSKGSAEFEVEVGEDGRTKAVNVTGPDGGLVKGGSSEEGGGGGGRVGVRRFGGGSSTCYKCGVEGHFSVNCPGGGGGGGGRGGGGGGTCYKCGVRGHFAGSCPN